MEIRENENICIYTPLTCRLEKRSCERLFREIKSDNRNIALDLSWVQDCTIDFIEGLRELALLKKIGVFNIPSEIFVLFNVMNMDKAVKLFVSEYDFIEDSRRLINRHFQVL